MTKQIVGPELLSCYGNLFDGNELEVISSWIPEGEQKSVIYACPSLHIYICQFDWFKYGHADITIGHLSAPPLPISWGDIRNKALDRTRVTYGALRPEPVFSHRNEALALVLADLF
jgi:hypothetical protein